MSDPQPTDPLHASGPTGDSDREARIEQLLLTGLDHYFAGQYEQAINVWTRVVFLERDHDRVRAYIERARSAQAERHREVEELVHTGVAAYDAGETDRARDFLTRAVAEGSDTAHVFLDRLNRMNVPAVVADVRADVQPARPPVAAAAPTIPHRTGWIAASILAVAVAITMLVGGLPIGTWLSELQGDSANASVQAPLAEPLPLVRTSEMLIARARTLYAGGHLHDALRTLDRIDIADPFRADADTLRAEIQRSLLAAAGARP
jgi:hypothetical protein